MWRRSPASPAAGAPSEASTSSLCPTSCARSEKSATNIRFQSVGSHHHRELQRYGDERLVVGRRWGRPAATVCTLYFDGKLILPRNETFSVPTLTSDKVPVREALSQEGYGFAGHPLTNNFHRPAPFTSGRSAARPIAPLRKSTGRAATSTRHRARRANHFAGLR